ncbi:vitellogenic carboxypeptidase-like [Octopus sinensis]|uniref:Carboxypeptidase n=1 Tax=Octopus sinensis TaxID=2607531 RepID=A0A6P7TS85_9MOLL|nr:vitellogenic carboxypeptidase-like [Octopus sinensis]
MTEGGFVARVIDEEEIILVEVQNGGERVITTVSWPIQFNNPNALKIDRNEPLIITDYLNNGQADLARELSRVEPFLGNIESFAGFFRIRLMQQFYQLFPELIPNQLYITGESYAGKYVPIMVYSIDQFNKNNPTPINLIGMAIGDGQLDVIIPYPATSEFLRQLEWNGKKDFATASQQIWYSTDGPKRVNGYYKSAGNVMQLIVRDVGHMVPMDNPEAAIEMLRLFIYGF